MCCVLQEEGSAPTPFRVEEGEHLVLITRFSADGVTMQFQLEREHERPAAAAYNNNKYKCCPPCD